MRIKAFLAGVLLAFFGMLLPITSAAPASATEFHPVNAGELKTAFDSATGIGTDTIVLGAAITVASGDGALVVPNGVTLRLDLNGYDLVVEGPSDFAGIGVSDGSGIVIFDSRPNEGAILAAVGGELGAGIGGGRNQTGGVIEILSGIVHAFGGNYGAGIGGGLNGGAGTIVINGGSVTAAPSDPSSHYSAAGIGGGTNGRSGAITIAGGVVDARGSSSGAGIGGGGASSGSNGGIIEITGGTVTAVGGNSGGSGIGSASSRSHGPITISGGTVTATGGGCSTYPGAGIGHHGGGSSPIPITIRDATVIATSGCSDGSEWAAAIGGGAGTSGAELAIEGAADVTVIAGTSVLPSSVIGQGSGASDALFGSLSIGPLSRVTVEEHSSLTIPSGATADNSGSLNIEGMMSVNGTLANGGLLENSGIILASGELLTSGTITNIGHLTVPGVLHNTGLIHSCCSLELFSGVNDGQIVNGTLSIAVLYVGFVNNATIENEGEIVVLGDAELNGPLQNNGTIDNSGGFIVDLGAAVTNTGAINNSGEILVEGLLSNDAVISNSGSMLINLSPESELRNRGAILGAGVIDDVGRVTIYNFLNSFELNGAPGTPPADQRVLAETFTGAAVPLPAAPTREGFTFAGWNSAADGSADTLSATLGLGVAPATLHWYAQWRIPPPPTPDPPTPDPPTPTPDPPTPTPPTPDPPTPDPPAPEPPTPTPPTPGPNDGSGDDPLAETGSESAMGAQILAFAILLLLGGAFAATLARNRASTQGQ